MPVVIDKYISRFVTKKGSALNCVNVVRLEDANYLGSLGFEVDYLIPDYCINKDDTLDKYFISFEESEYSTGNSLAIFLTAVCFWVLIYINCKSTNTNKVDWFRLISVYVGGTLVVAFWENFGPDYGFNRFIGFAILTHNLGEFLLIFYLWFGSLHFNIPFMVAIIIYVMIMTLSIAYLNLNGLFIFGSMQGASMDFMLIITYLLVCSKFKKTNNKTSYKAFLTGFIGAILHLVSITPIFAGMWLGNSTIQFSSTIFVAPAFMIYTLFAAQQLGHISILGSSIQPITNESNIPLNEISLKVISLNDDKENDISSISNESKTIEDNGILGKFYNYPSPNNNQCIICTQFIKYNIFWIVVIVSILLSVSGNTALLFLPCFGEAFGVNCVRRL